MLLNIPDTWERLCSVQFIERISELKSNLFKEKATSTRTTKKNENNKLKTSKSMQKKKKNENLENDGWWWWCMETNENWRKK